MKKKLRFLPGVLLDNLMGNDLGTGLINDQLAAAQIRAVVQRQTWHVNIAWIHQIDEDAKRIYDA